MEFENVLSLFDGISGGQIALGRAGIKVKNYYASEINKNAIKIAQHNYPDTIQMGDIRDLKATKLPKIDLLLGGSPCQGFSIAGNELNFIDARSRLFFEYARLLKELKPTYFLMENTPMKPEFEKIISGYLGVKPIMINSSLVSGQNRKRLYWTNIPDVKLPEDKKIHLKSIVGDYDGIFVYPRGFNKGGVQSYNGKSPTITTSAWQHNFFVQKDDEKRKFTVDEVEQLQTLPLGYTQVPTVSENQRYKLIGDGWTIDVISHILSHIIE